MSYQKIKGTLDFIGIDSERRRYVENVARSVMESYNISEIITPVFEQTEVFNRSSGESSDIVTKEMYTFLDKGNRSITLRPEGTASIIRAFLENKLYALPGVKKYFYNLPMYRYERPQAGRYREFVQFGVEFFGEESYMLDADVIVLGDTILKKLGLNGKYKIVINTIGDLESRNNYQNALKQYFSNKIDDLCEDCKKRLDKNPMRILDCKVDKDNPILLNAPKISEYLSDNSKEYFTNLLKVLDYLQIEYEINPSLVRGLDYYTDTVFEFISKGDEKDPVSSLKNVAILAGGRYSGLTKILGGPDVPGIGFAFGVERVTNLLAYYDLLPTLENKVDICLLSLDPDSKNYCLDICRKLREEGIICEIDYINNSLKPQFKLAERVNSRLIGIIGETERLNSSINIKCPKTGKQETISVKELIKYIKENKGDA